MSSWDPEVLEGRRGWLKAAAMALLTPELSAANQPRAWPTARPIELVVPYPSGGATDLLARLYADKLQARLGQTVSVNNLPGVNTLLATKYVMEQPSDGYTLYLGVSAWAQSAALQPKVYAYDMGNDFSYISMLVVQPMVLVVNPSLPVRSIDDLLALARKRRSRLIMATTGVGSIDHLLGALLAHHAGVSFDYVPYKGAAPAVQDVIAGAADFRVDGVTTSKPHIESGKLRAIAIAGRRTRLLTGLPSISDTVPGVSAEAYTGLVGPRGLPQPVIDRLHRESQEILALPDVVARLRSAGMDPSPSTPEVWRDAALKDGERWRRLIKATGIQLD